MSYVKEQTSDESLKNVCDILDSRNHKTELEEDVLLRNMKSKIILAVGDDANILRTFRELGDKDHVVLGVSLGEKSFLGEIDVKSFKPALRMIEKKRHFVEKRLRLAATIDGKRLPYALNELVVSSSMGTTMMRYSLRVDDELVFRDFADGVIISTPTGSTGYALSAGGPVISIKSDSFLAIPICSVNQNKPFVMSDKSVIKITDISSRGKCVVIIDGRCREEMDKNVVTIKKARSPARFMRFDKDVHSDVFRKLKSRGLETNNIPKNAPPSSKYIYKLLQYEGPMTHKELVDSSMLPARTVRSALNHLVKNGLIVQQTSIRDTRQSIYSVK